MAVYHDRGDAAAVAVHADHDRFLETGAVPDGVRELVADSWRRSLLAGVDADHSAPPVGLAAAELRDYRSAHPLARAYPVLHDLLGDAAAECDSLVAIADADGRLLWVEGRPDVLGKAERINFVEGTVWDEKHAGTNAPGTALRLQIPVQIRAAEHFSRPVQPWSCTAAPIHDPGSGELLGVIDVTGSDAVASAVVMSTVRAAALAAQGALVRPAATTAAASQPGELRLEALGRSDVLIRSGARSRRLSHRHSEIVILLASRPQGMTGDQLAVEVHAGRVSDSTLRAELVRLRAILGPALRSRPYRLTEPVTADWLDVERQLDRGGVTAALTAYRGPLLPSSEAPGVEELRHVLHGRVRRALLCAADIDLLADWTSTRWGCDDVDVWRRQLDLLPIVSPVRQLVTRELRRLDEQLGTPGSGSTATNRFGATNLQRRHP